MRCVCFFDNFRTVVYVETVGRELQGVVPALDGTSTTLSVTAAISKETKACLVRYVGEHIDISLRKPWLNAAVVKSKNMC